MRKGIDPVGFFSVWSAWYIDVRLSNPDIDRKELVNWALGKLKKIKKDKNGGRSFTQFIRDYAEMIVEVSEEIKSHY